MAHDIVIRGGTIADGNCGHLYDECLVDAASAFTQLNALTKLSVCAIVRKPALSACNQQPILRAAGF